MSSRIIFHVDMDAFFASVEIAKNPSLKNLPLIVGGKPDQRGVVSTCSYEARKYGIHSAMSLFEAKKRCPHAVFLECDFALYRLISESIMKTFEKMTPLVEIVSIDEAYLDVTHKIHDQMDPTKLANLLREYIFQKYKLTCSIGIASNKLLAKIASGFAKPNKVFFVEKGKEKEFLAPLPIETIPGIGPKSKQFFNQNQIGTIGQLQEFPLEFLIHKYGNRGYELYFTARGVHFGSVNTHHSLPKSIGAEHTFDQDCGDSSLLEKELDRLIDKAYRRLTRYSMRAKGISLKIRFSDFTTITRSRTLFTHTQHLETLKKEFCELYQESYFHRTPLRLIGVSFEKLTEKDWQPTLWPWEHFEKT